MINDVKYGDMSESFKYSDILDVNHIQKIQDDFANVANVGSVIYDLKGTPITKPSNFCEYCQIIRGTEKGLKNCMKSDAALWELAKNNRGGAILCESGKLMDGIAPIIVEGRRIANWGMGQVLFEKLDEQWVRQYAKEIGTDENLLLKALEKVKIIPRENFLKTIEYLIIFSRELSEIALANYRLKNEIISRIKSEERYSAIVNNAVVGICEITNKGNLEYVNNQLCDMLGYDREELIGKKFNRICQSERDFESYFKGIVDYANRSYANIGYDFNGYFERKQKEPLSCRICLTPQKNLSNQVIKSSAVIIDTSAEINALEKLEARNRELFESKKQMELFFNSNVTGLCIYNNSFKRLNYNPAYVKYAEEIGNVEPLSKNELWEPIDKAQLLNILSGEIREYAVKKEYGLKLYNFKASAIPDYDNTITRFLIAIEDITDYHVMMENMLFAEKMSGVGMLASGIAHDLKGIFAILGNSNYTMKTYLSSGSGGVTAYREKFEELLSMQEEGLAYGRRLLAQLLSFAGKKAETSVEFILKECIEHIIRIYKREILEKNAEVVVTVRDNVVIKGLQSKFIRIIINIFVNALEAINTNGCVYFSEECEPGRLKMTVSDNGHGIGGGEKEKIFQAFYTTKEKGTGLGLFSVKNIIQELGGTIEVESEKDVGSKFIIEIKDNLKIATVIRDGM